MTTASSLLTLFPNAMCRFRTSLLNPTTYRPEKESRIQDHRLLQTRYSMNDIQTGDEDAESITCASAQKKPESEYGKSRRPIQDRKVDIQGVTVGWMRSPTDGGRSWKSEMTSQLQSCAFAFVASTLETLKARQR